jgi:hypothetical protein
MCCNNLIGWEVQQRSYDRVRWFERRHRVVVRRRRWLSVREQERGYISHPFISHPAPTPPNSQGVPSFSMSHLSSLGLTLKNALSLTWASKKGFGPLVLSEVLAHSSSLKAHSSSLYSTTPAGKNAAAPESHIDDSSAILLALVLLLLLYLCFHHWTMSPPPCSLSPGLCLDTKVLLSHVGAYLENCSHYILVKESPSE